LHFNVAVLQQAGRSPNNRMLTKYWKPNTGITSTVPWGMKSY